MGRRDARRTRWRAGPTHMGAAALLLLLVSACGRVSDDERRAIVRWLTCEECDAGERAAVVSIGSPAVPLLAQALEDTATAVNRELRRGFESELNAAYDRMTRPVAREDFVAAEVTRYFESVRVRGAQALGDLGAEAELRSALADSLARGFGPRAISALRSALDRASSAGAPGPDTLVVQPDSIRVEVGATARFVTIPLDSVGRTLPGVPLTWGSSDSSVAVVDASGNVVGVAPGMALASAIDVNSGATGVARVFVVPVVERPVLRVLDGDRQSDTAYTRLTGLLQVEVTKGGTELPAYPVSWAVIQGGGRVRPLSATTDAAGVARAAWQLGAPGPQRIRVQVADGVPVVLRAEAVAGPTAILGVVANDRDRDGNLLDPGEAVGGVEIEVYRSLVHPDSLLVTTTTDSLGRYGIPGLPPGTYIVRADGAPAGVTVLRSLAASGVRRDTVHVTTGTSTTDPGAPLTVQVGDTVLGSTGLPAAPWWSAEPSIAVSVAPSHFSFLFRDGAATGVVQNAGGTGVSGMTVVLRRCATAAGAHSPPAEGTCASYLPGASNVVTDAAGRFGFTGLEEGVYEITPQPGSAGLTSASPAASLYILLGRADVEASTFVVS